MKSISERIVLLKDEYEDPEESYKNLIRELATSEHRAEKINLLAWIGIEFSFLVGFIVGFFLYREAIMALIIKEAPEVLPLLFK